ncbi:MAG: sulfatase-like hydrolase/transferase, partial [bacterium]|nr:sulfatase-like hydrolase/transferase [bacterium]
PLLDLAARHAELFVVRRSTGGEIIALVVFLLVLLPLPLVLVDGLAQRIGRRFGELVHGAVVAALAALILLQALKRPGLDGLLWLVPGLAAGLALAWACHRFAAMRWLNTYLALSLIVVPAVFLGNPRILTIISGGSAAELFSTGARTPILFLVLDELSLTALLDVERRIDRVSYPNLAAFAGEATWFPNAVTSSEATELAVPALVTGKIPRPERLPLLEDHPRNLFTLFGGDYRIWSREPITHLCPPAVNTPFDGLRSDNGQETAPSQRLRRTAASEKPAFEAAGASFGTLVSDLWIVYQHLLLPPRYSARLPSLAGRWQNFRGVGGPAARPTTMEDFSQAALRALRRDRVEEMRRLIAAPDPDVDNALYFLHLMLPHTPWEYLPNGKRYWPHVSRIPGVTRGIWTDDEALTVQAYQRYLLQIRFLDRLFGEFLDRLRALDLYDRSLIVLVADHGVSFRPGDSRRALTSTNYHDLIAIPLLIKAPYQRRGRVVDRQVSGIDVLPSILDLLDVDPPWPMDGQSAFAPAEEPGMSSVVGKRRVMELDANFHRDKYLTLDWKLGTFGADLEGVLRAGTYPELVGRKVEEVGWREQGTVTMQLNGESLFRRHDVAGADSPAFISGTLETTRSDKDCCDLAVAVNGTLYATARTFASAPDDLQFTALVPDRAFRSGDNRVEVFRVRRGGPEPVLERLSSSGGSAYALVKDSQGRVVSIRRDERTIRIRADAIRGYMDTPSITAGRVSISGWAVDLTAAAPPEQILVFHQGELVYAGTTSMVRDGVTVSLGLSKPIRSAFRFSIPLSKVPELARSGVQLFALSQNGVASPLGFFQYLQCDEAGSAIGITATNGREIPILAGALAGHLDEAVSGQAGLSLTGWAADLRHREPAEAIFIFAGRRAIHVSRSMTERPDVAETHRMPEILKSGFQHVVSREELRQHPGQRLFLVATSKRGQATVLATLPGPP